jgi:hypothetical protein
MATTKPHGLSFAAHRELVEMAKTMTLDEIVRLTGRRSRTILRMAPRSGISTKRLKPKAKAR